MGQKRRIIKKYANRRLYDTETSQSITLADVRDLIGAGQPVKIVEARTDKDVTRSVLLQIVADQEMLGQPVLSNEFLEAMIRVDSNPMRDLARDYLEQAMVHMESQQETIDDAWTSTLKKTGLEDLPGATLEPFRQFQKQVFSAWTEALTPNRREKAEGDDSSN